MGGRDRHRPPSLEDEVSYSYIPGSKGGDPMRAVKLLIRWIVYPTVIGLAWKFLFKGK